MKITQTKFIKILAIALTLNTTFAAAQTSDLPEPSNQHSSYHGLVPQPKMSNIYDDETENAPVLRFEDEYVATKGGGVPSNSSNSSDYATITIIYMDQVLDCRSNLILEINGYGYLVESGITRIEIPVGKFDYTIKGFLHCSTTQEVKSSGNIHITQNATVRLQWQLKDHQLNGILLTNATAAN